MAESLLSTTAPDQAQREAALDIHQSCIVEAPAGSGKTSLLVQRFLKLLSYGEIDQPEQVLAITFARDATAEIRHRISDALDRAASNAPLEDTANPSELLTRALASAVLARSQQLQWGLLQQPQRINVRSIDAVCADIVGRLPILSNAGARLSPVEETRPLYRQAAQRLLQSLGAPDTTSATDRSLVDRALTDLLRHRDGRLADCETLIAEMLQWRDQWGRLVPLSDNLSDALLDQQVKPRLERTLQHAICRALENAERLFPPAELHELARLTHGAAQVLEQKPKSHLKPWLQRTSPPSCTHDELDAWRALKTQLLKEDGAWRDGSGPDIRQGFNAKSPEKAAIQSLIARLSTNEPLRFALVEVSRLPDAVYPDAQWRMAKSLFRLLKWAMVELQILFAETGQCDFTEVSLAAHRALSQHSGPDDLAVSIGARLQHLLVDEMQDTSVSQYDLLRSLTQSWDGHSQTVFLVGDPSQSIYLFRQARVELFHQTVQNGLGDLPLQHLRLTANFRSQRALVDQFNQDFSLIFPGEPAHADDVPFIAADPVRSASSAGRGWHVESYPGARYSPEHREGRDRSRSKEADSIVAILDRHHRQATPEKPAPRIAVLVRARTHLLLLAEALARHGNIPYRAVEIDALAEQQEVLDALSLTRALLHPSDRVAWLSILRAPWCGLALAELRILTGGDHPSAKHIPITQLIESNRAQLDPQAQLRLAHLLDAMQAAEGQRARLPLAQWVERTWRQLGGPECLGPQGVANVQAYFRFLEKCDAESTHVDAALLAERMRDLHAASQTSHPQAVELLTMHRAKGLEWDVVIVPGLERTPPPPTATVLSWFELPGDAASKGEPYSMLVPMAARGEDSHRLNDWVKGLQAQRRAAEYKRLYYVACTRAREDLHLFASARQSDDGHAFAKQSLLEVAWPIAEPHFTAARKKAADSGLLLVPAADSAGKVAPDADRPQDGVLDALAASASPSPSTIPRLRRLPLAFFTTPRADKTADQPPLWQQRRKPAQAPTPSPARPQGSLSARALGNTVHAFLERLSAHFAASRTLADARPLPALWKPRIALYLRSQGLSAAQAQHNASLAVQALDNALDDPQGQWLLAAHQDAASESALSGWSSLADPDQPETSFSLRLDRVFRAGAQPLSDSSMGEGHIWIVDYKTAAHSGAGLENFLENEKKTYRAKMDSYARALRLLHGEDVPINLALYYPLMRHLLWWTFQAPSS